METFRQIVRDKLAKKVFKVTLAKDDEMI